MAHGPYFLVVRYSGGSVRLLNQFDGLHEFLTRLEELNPEVTMNGCQLLTGLSIAEVRNVWTGSL